MAPFSGDIEATGAVGSQKLLEAGLSPFTADCVHHRGVPVSGMQSVENGPFTIRNQENGDMPVWSAGRLLTMLTTSDDFYWSLYRSEESGDFVLTVFADGKETKFTDARLINVVLPAALLCIETGNLKTGFSAKGFGLGEGGGGLFRRGLSGMDAPYFPKADLEAIYPSIDKEKLFEELYSSRPIVSDAVDAMRGRVEAEKAARYREYIEKTSARVITLDKDGRPLDQLPRIGDIVKTPDGDTIGMVFGVEPEGKVKIVELK